MKMWRVTQTHFIGEYASEGEAVMAREALCGLNQPYDFQITLVDLEETVYDDATIVFAPHNLRRR